jgi:glycerate kinase
LKTTSPGSPAFSGRSGTDIASLKGGGAAGGMGATLQGILGADISSGIDLVLNTLNFDEQVRGADLVITGEGRLDAQTSRGKGPAGVISRAHAHGCPSIALAGSLGSGYEALYALGSVRHFRWFPALSPMNARCAKPPLCWNRRRSILPRCGIWLRARRFVASALR